MTAEIKYENKPWLAHYERGVPEHIDYEQITLPAYLEKSARQYPERIAIICEGFKISYRRLNEMTNRFAACLSALGTGRGDRVAILLPNVIPCVISYYATLKIGAIAVMCNPQHTDRELLFQFQDSAATVLITMNLLANRMIALRPQTELKQIIHTSFGDYLPLAGNLIFPLVAGRKGLSARVQPAENVYRWKNVLSNYSASHRPTGVSMDDVAMIQYTGGTTGIAKGVMLTHANLSFQTQQIDAWFPQFAGQDEIILGALPFFHSFGLTCSMNNAIFASWTNVLIPSPRPKKLLTAIHKYRPTFAPLVPTMYIDLLNHPDIRKTSMTCIKGCFSGSAPLPLEVIRKFEGLTGAAISEGFGLTEAAPITHANPFNGVRKVGSVGLPFPDTECRIVDLAEGTTDVPVGQSGELLVRGPQVMKGYWNNPQETASTLKDGWLFTGDIARMDEEGYFYIVDRKKDMVISGGHNVYPREIDEVLYRHPKIKEVCAIGLPHPSRGEQIKAFVVPVEGASVTSEELIEYCQSRLAAYKLPTGFEFRKDLPKSHVGKILRKVLREEELAK
ncbi:MAG: long-chain fatty acid--CoA ligase [Desulfobacteraceae bacterium]|jgi:long-chain acyl-CoA synthetase|nr:long-chain fatty acid--CoA ligase [Desulfobacteraceae bacterium]